MPDELTPVEIEAFLREQVVARIGCHADGETYVVPVIYAYGDGAAHVISVDGRKIRMMRANPSVCFEVDSYEADTGSWRSVIAQGTFEQLDGDDARAALALLGQSFAERTGRRPARPPSPEGTEIVAFRIRLDEASGREVRRGPG